MSAVTTATAVRGTGPKPQPWAVLGRFELRRLLRHPALLGFSALALVWMSATYIEQRAQRAGLLYGVVANGPGPWVPTAIGLAIAAGLAADRSRRHDLEPLFTSSPVQRNTRQCGLLAAVVGVGALSALAVGVFITVTGGWDGLPVLLDTDNPTRHVSYPVGTQIAATDVRPSAFELLAGPAALVVWGLAGIAAARAVGGRLLVVLLPVAGMVQLIMATWAPPTPTRWFWPFVTSARYVGWLDLNDDGFGVGIVSGFNVAATGWHLVYLTGVALVLVTVVVWPSRSLRTSVAIGTLGVVLAVTGGIAQLATYTPDLRAP